MIHGILASVAFLILFPLGSIAMATLRGRWAYWVHVVSQMLGWFMFIAVAALGFRMLGEVRIRTREGRESLVSLSHSFSLSFFLGGGGFLFFSSFWCLCFVFKGTTEMMYKYCSLRHD